MKEELQRKKMVGSKVRESIAQTKYSLAFWCKLAYTFFQKTKKVAKSLLGLPYMPARTLNDFLCGLFYGRQRRFGGRYGNFTGERS